MVGPHNSSLGAMLGGGPRRPLTLEESKMLFRVSVGAASSTGPLRFVKFNAKKLTLIAFGVGLALGAFPQARKGLGRLLSAAMARSLGGGETEEYDYDEYDEEPRETRHRHHRCRR